MLFSAYVLIGFMPTEMSSGKKMNSWSLRSSFLATTKFMLVRLWKLEYLSKENGFLYGKCRRQLTRQSSHRCWRCLRNLSTTFPVHPVSLCIHDHAPCGRSSCRPSTSGRPSSPPCDGLCPCPSHRRFCTAKSSEYWRQTMTDFCGETN